MPPVDGLDALGHLDNRTVFDLREQPEHLVVLGGGPIGVELAQAFRRLGSQVTVVEGAPTVLSREEPEAAAVVTAVLQREGVRVLTGAQVVRAARGPSGGPVLALADGTSVEGSHLLVAVGRTPATDGLGLETAGVALDRGRVVTDDHLQAADTVWAAGDCTSRLQFTHVGDEQGRLAAGNAFARPGPGPGGGAPGTTAASRGSPSPSRRSATSASPRRRPVRRTATGCASRRRGTPPATAAARPARPTASSSSSPCPAGSGAWRSASSSA